MRLDEYTVKIEGNWRFELQDSEGRTLEVREVKNLVVNGGKGIIAALINGAGSTTLRYIAIGTGATAAAATDTVLQAEITTSGGARLLGTCSNATITVAGDTARIVATFAFTGSFTVTEAGTFTAAAAGTMGNRSVFAGIPVISGQSLLVQVDLKVT